MARKLNAATAVGLFLLALAPRLAGLGSYLTPDERLWSIRTAQFLQALLGRDWAATMTTGHPGVTVTWAGSLGVALKALLDRPADATSVAGLAAALAAEPSRLDMIAWLRLPIALTTALGILVILHLARRLLPPPVPLLAAGLLAWSPFLLAHSRVLQMDGLLAIFVTVAWLALLVATHSGRRRYYLLSGVAAGLGLLTKSPALSLGPPMLGWIVWHRWRSAAATDQGSRRPAWSVLTHIAADLLWIGLPALATLLLLWPALWVAPLATLGRVWQFSFALGGIGHELGNYWLGRPVASPGILFYPAVLLWRTTPVTLLGLLLAALGLRSLRSQPVGRPAAADIGTATGPVRRPARTGAERTAWPTWPLLAFALWFGLVMSLGAKKFDRYLLPAFPALILLAAWGWSAVLERVARRRQWSMRWPAMLAAVLVIGQGGFAIANYPSYLTAYNPLAGGIATARQIMLVGWGEGLEEAAAFLNQQPEAGRQRAAAWYGHNVFGPFYQGQSYDLFYDLPTAADLYANDVDYVVTYINQTQRGLLDESIAARLGRPLMASVRHGVPLAQVYTWPKPYAHTGDRQLAPGMRLLGWEVERTDQMGDQLLLTLYWDAAVASAAAELPPIQAWLKDETGQVWAMAAGRLDVDAQNLLVGWLDHRSVPLRLTLELPLGLMAGPYRLEMAPQAGTILALTEIDIAASRWDDAGQMVGIRLADVVVFGETIRLAGYGLHADSADMQLDLLWTALADPPLDTKYFVHVVDAGDQIVAQYDGVLAARPGQPPAWQAGDLVRQRVRITLPPDAAGRPLRVYVGLYGAQSGQRLPFTVGGTPAADDRYLLLSR